MELPQALHSSQWRFSNFAPHLPAEFHPAGAVQSNADVVISGNTVTINQLPTGIESLQLSPDEITLKVTQSPARPLKIYLGRAAHSALEATMGRLTINVARAQKLTIEQTLNGAQVGFSSLKSELNLEDDAHVDHAIIITEGDEGLNASEFFSTLSTRARLCQTLIARGGKLTRLHLKSVINGEGAHAQLASLANLAGKSVVDVNSELIHNAATTTATQLAKNLLNDESRAIFTGKVFIARDSQQVAAEQMNRTLLLSKKAQAISQPQLEIFADDVKCAHGSTTGQIEEDATFYLLSRGIAADRARALLTQAFVDEVVHNAPVELRGFLAGAL
jgi:Fe-S cluster assembly protein SufD